MSSSKSFGTDDEETLREAACVGNIDGINELLLKGADVNSTNKVNGWTPLHWASKRGHAQVVEILLKHGADKNIKTSTGQTAASLADKEEIRKLLGALTPEGDSNAAKESKVNFTPNYLANPEFLYSQANHVDLSKPIAENCALAKGTSGHNGFYFCPTSVKCTQGNQWSPSGLVIHPDVMILCVRLANVSKLNNDFIEVEVSRHNAPSLAQLTELLCSSLDIGIKPESVQKIHKLPHTVLKNDRDVLRLTDYQLLEVVLQPDALHPFDGTIVSSGDSTDALYLKQHASKLVY